jgi:hypothetical protein
MKSLKIPKGYEEGHTTQWSKEKRQKDKQRYTKHYKIEGHEPSKSFKITDLTTCGERHETF